MFETSQKTQSEREAEIRCRRIVAYQALAPLVQLPAGSCDCLIRQHFHLCIKSCMTQRVLPLSSCSLDNSHQLTGAINDPCGANCLTRIDGPGKWRTAEEVPRQRQLRS
ncbi:hypothetical protein CDV36_014311 [Fusarium kuroshium]|uniref:Uncharacterized protein n=1 Tax=Fusarium kuroshium TaxID=2010991 RepID=A0A3M2RIF0_9HYPO|nr:hypothetical protein CDV36_014311 [Fusarium kuroshium]